MTSSNRSHRYRNISLWIDSYDDIFSDFDPRPVAQRQLSDDFLLEIKKVIREKNDDIDELIFLIPREARNNNEENRIIQRLQTDFRKQHTILTELISKEKRKGIVLTLTGMTMMFLASLISLEENGTWLQNALRILLEPPGWFMVWMGLETYFHSRKSTTSDLSIYEKLSKSNISFEDL